MSAQPAPQFLMFPEGILNVNDISTIAPYRKDGQLWTYGMDASGVRVTFMSKGTFMDLPGQSVPGLHALLSGVPY
jgi:hypothetical protein